MKVAENVYAIRYNADRTAYASDLAEIEEAINAEEKKSGRPYYLCGEVYEPGIAGEWKYAGHYSIDSNVSPNVCYKGFEGVRYVLIGNYAIDEALAMIDAAEKQNEKKEETKTTNEKKNELLNAKKILLESFERGEDLTDFSTLSETTKNAFDLLRDFFRDRPDNASRHFWEYKKELSYHRFSDKQDDEHLYAGARLLYRQFLVALTDCVDWYLNEYAEKVEE